MEIGGEITAWKEIYDFCRFPVWLSLRSVGRLRDSLHLVWTVLSVLTTHFCSVDTKIFLSSILRSSVWKDYFLYLLIHSSLCLINIYWAAAVYPGKEPSVMFTYIYKKWLLSLRSSKEKEKPDVMNIRMGCCRGEGHLLQNGGGEMWSEKVFSRRRNLNWVLKHSYELTTWQRWVGLSQHSERGKWHHVCRRQVSWWGRYSKPGTQ